jgi:hypothetical protein
MPITFTFHNAEPAVNNDVMAPRSELQPVPTGSTQTGSKNHTSYAFKPDRKGKVAGSIPDEVIALFFSPNSSSRTMALGSTQLLKEMSTRNLPGGKGWLARKADNLTTICEPIV